MLNSSLEAYTQSLDTLCLEEEEGGRGDERHRDGEEGDPDAVGRVERQGAVSDDGVYEVAKGRQHERGSPNREDKFVAVSSPRTFLRCCVTCKNVKCKCHYPKDHDC